MTELQIKEKKEKKHKVRLSWSDVGQIKERIKLKLAIIHVTLQMSMAQLNSTDLVVLSGNRYFCPISFTVNIIMSVFCRQRGLRDE